MDISQQSGSPYWKILLFSIFMMFALIIIRVWVIEIAVAQGFLSTFQHIISTQLTLSAADTNSVLGGQNFVIFALRRLCEGVMVVLVIYNIVYIFKNERQQTYG